MSADASPYKLQKHAGMTITTTMTYSRRAMGFLWAKRTELDPAQVAILDSLYNARNKGSIECSYTSKYQHSKSNAGKLGYGRLMGSKGSLEKLERECRGTLCREHYLDIDVVNAHPVLLAQFAKRNYGKDLVEVESYIENRDQYLKAISDNRDDAKKAIIAAMYNGAPTCEKIKPFHAEIHKFTKFLLSQDEFADLKNAVRNEPNVYGSFLSYILQTIECDIMLTMKASLEKLGWAVDVLAYDGVMVRKTESDKLQEHLRTTEADIKEKTGFEVKLLVKPFEFFELPPVKDEIVEGVLRDDYNAMKAEFEQNHFYFAPMNQYGMYKDGEIHFLDLPHATEMFQTKWRFTTGSKFNDYVEFFKLWRADPTRRTITKIDYKPSTDPETFVQPLEFAYTKVEVDETTEEFKALQKKVIWMFNKLVELNTNNVKKLTNHFIKYFAHLLQKPFELPKVALIITGQKGTGKDTLIDFIMEFILGYKYCTNYQNNEQFFSKHDCARAGKFLVKLEEADRKHFVANASYFKSMITASHSMFNPKGKKEYSLPNYLRIGITTNGANPMEANGGERRGFIVASSAEKKGDLNFWKGVRNTMFNSLAGYIVAKYLLEIDLSDFVVWDLPENEYQKAVVDAEKTSEDRFIEEWDGEELKSNDFYRAYKDFCTQNDLAYAPNSISLGRSLLKYVRDGVLLTRKGAGNATFYKKP